MSKELEHRLIHIEEKLARLERLVEQLNQATTDQELRLEKVQAVVEGGITRRPTGETPDGER